MSNLSVAFIACLQVRGLGNDGYDDRANPAASGYRARCESIYPGLVHHRFLNCGYGSRYDSILDLKIEYAPSNRVPVLQVIRSHELARSRVQFVGDSAAQHGDHRLVVVW